MKIFVNDHGTIYEVNGHFVTRILRGKAQEFFRRDDTGEEIPKYRTRETLTGTEAEAYKRQTAEREAEQAELWAAKIEAINK